jgi:hypothetical protein
VALIKRARIRKHSTRAPAKRSRASKQKAKPATSGALSSAHRSILPALDYLERAEDFMEAFRALPSGNPPSWPRYFLLCHAIELALKAFLILRGVSSGTLKSPTFRHNLKQLLAEAVNYGLRQAAPYNAEFHIARRTS